MSKDPIVEPADLPSLPAFQLLDVREPASFDTDHPAHATRVPIEVWEAAAKTGETSFENVSYWEAAIVDLGVSDQALAVVYDDGRMTEAARVWFILQYFGVPAVILNGGWPAIRGRQDLLKTSTPAKAMGSFRARPAAGPVGLVDRTALKADLAADVRIFDARTQPEFAGEDLRRNARGGHLPGARLIPHVDLLDGSRLRPAPELLRLLSEAGFQPGDHIVTHCDGGGRAALAAAAAARAGFDNVRAYYLSFADWAKDESCPVVKR